MGIVCGVVVDVGLMRRRMWARVVSSRAVRSIVDAVVVVVAAYVFCIEVLSGAE